MRLTEALQIVGQNAGERQRKIHLVCGFTPLHLETFVKANLRLRFPDDRVCVEIGLYGDLEGNIQRGVQQDAEGLIVVIEWSDLDPRLGMRSSSGWRKDILDDITRQIEQRCERLQSRLAALAKTVPVALLGPTLALPPVSHLPTAQTDPLELALNAILAGFLRSCAQSGIRIVNHSALAARSPYAARHDIKMDLHAGFPYTLPHADAVAHMAVSSLFPVSPKKGLITDLDQTLWKGVLGEVGVDGVSWSLEGRSQGHALYQQLLASLAESGVLLAIASKNDLELVENALGRPDCLVRPDQIFPVEVNWGAKSEAVGRILEIWNISAASVVFIDDSPMELAEVSERFPEVECLRFPSGDPAGILALLWQLRARFGKEHVGVEDRLRLRSLRAADQIAKERPAEAPTDFLARMEAKMTFEPSGSDLRALELVNKTNQFNLNGTRYSEAEWKTRIRQPGTFLTTISYEDRFGPLGRIAVLGGCLEQDRCLIDIWVMSCRAFSRQIEFQALQRLFATFGVSRLRLRFKPTARNQPLQAFLRHFFPPESMTKEELDLAADVFKQSCPPLFHEVTDRWTTSKAN